MSEHVTEHVPAEQHAHGQAATAEAFTDAEWSGFRAEDFSAGRAVVLLMLSIFCTGVIIYSIVAYWVINFS